VADDQSIGRCANRRRDRRQTGREAADVGAGSGTVAFGTAEPGHSSHLRQIMGLFSCWIQMIAQNSKRQTVFMSMRRII